MKQALLVTAYKDEEQLFRLIKPFIGLMRIFIHIDRRSHDLNAERLRGMQLDDVEVIDAYKVCWGSINHVWAIVALMRMAMRYDDIGYCHIVSGQDVAIHDFDWFQREFSDAGNESFFCGRNQYVKDSHRRDWYGYYHLPSRWNHHNKWLVRIEKMLLIFQRRLGIRRKWIGELSIDQLRSSLVWGSCPRGACETIIKFVDEHPKFMRAANYTAIPEEMIFATALGETKYHVIEERDQCYRYMEWVSGRGSPATLDETDWPEIQKRISGECAFVRKVDSNISRRLIDIMNANGIC